ncbi:MAG: hypothetical protein QOE35_3020 [Actinomycetota bacterium]
MTFKGWPVEAIEFFEGLEADNSKTYWTANKSVYEDAVRAPMEALLQQLTAEFGPGKVYRPYRDVRFSADKTPYKTAIAASNERGYVQLSSQGLAAATGYWHMARDQLVRYRAAVDDKRKGAALEAITVALRKARYTVGGAGVRTAPRGYKADHPRIELLRFTDMTVWREWPPAAWLGTAKAADRIVKVWRDAAPLTDWLDEYVGPSTEPTR